MSYLLAMDQGTTSSRSILFDIDGRQVCAAQKEFDQHFPEPGWVEHDPEDIWRSQVDTTKEVLDRAGAKAGQVAAIGITNQRETVLAWERDTGTPLHKAIVWQDKRTAPFIAKLKQEGLEPRFREKTGLVLDPYFSGSKIAWLIDNIAGVKERATRGEICFGTVDSWLIYRLTGGKEHVTDVTNASRTLLFNIHTMEWDDELLDIFNIPKLSLPEVRPSTGLFGHTDPQLFGRSIPITAVAGDQHAALFGQVCFSPGMLKNTYGTGAFVMMNIGLKPHVASGLLTTLAWQIKGQEPLYALEGSIFIAGAAIQWLRDGLGIIESASEAEQIARSVEDTGGVYFVPALVGLGSPYWDPHARGLIIGLTRGTTRAHLIRAAIEAMAYQSKAVIDTMEKVSDTRLEELRVDGGAAQNNFLLEFQAGLLGKPVVRPVMTETTALGAAYLAGIGADLMDQEAITRLWTLDRRFEPEMIQESCERLWLGWNMAVERARGWV